jgi:prepilin-type N-terminal cleavage/methylation domain-containing protein
MKQNVTGRGREGFTLIEVLVTLILLAVLAAAVFPVVTKQSDSADPVRAASDLAAIRAGVEAFRLDARPNWPADLEDLAYAPVAGDPDLNGNAFDHADKWKGPYLDVALDTANAAVATGLAFTTGFDGEIQNDFVCLSTGITPLANWPASADCANGNVIAVEIQELSALEAEKLEASIDNSAALNLTGKFRHAGGTTTVGYYVVGPFF